MITLILKSHIIGDSLSWLGLISNIGSIKSCKNSDRQASYKTNCCIKVIIK